MPLFGFGSADEAPGSMCRRVYFHDLATGRHQRMYNRA